MFIKYLYTTDVFQMSTLLLRPFGDVCVMSEYAEHIRTAEMTFDLLTRVFWAGSWITHIQQWDMSSTVCVLALSLHI